MGLLSRLLPRPQSPRTGDDNLDRTSNPENTCHASRAPLQPSTTDTAHQESGNGRDAAIALHIPRKRGDNFRIGEEIAVDAGEYASGHLAVAKNAARDDLAAKLPCEQADGEQHALAAGGDETVAGAEPGDRGAGQVGDDAGLGEGGGDEDGGGLEEERKREGGFAARAEAAGLAEDEAAEGEGGDGGQRAEPEEGVAVREAGAAEGEEDGVAGLHAHEGAGGVDGHAVAEARGEAAAEEGDVGVVGVDVVLKPGEPRPFGLAIGTSGWATFGRGTDGVPSLGGILGWVIRVGGPGGGGRSHGIRSSPFFHIVRHGRNEKGLQRNRGPKAP